jgi:hypothetical protein
MKMMLKIFTIYGGKTENTRTRLSFTCRPWFTPGKRVEITGKNADISKN